VKQLAKSLASDLARVGFGAWGLERSLAGRRDVPALKDVRSILAIRLNLLGDLLFTMPSIAALRAAAPQATITMLALPYTTDLLRSFNVVDRIVPVDVNGWRRPSQWLAGRAEKEAREAMAELRGEQFDLCINFYGQVGAAFATMSGARYTVGYRAEGYSHSFDLALPGRRYDSRRHEAEYCLDLVRALGVTSAVELPGLVADPLADARARTLLREAGAGAGERVVAIHPGALNMAAKRWFADRWAAVADRIQTELHSRVALVGSASELPLADAIRRSMHSKPLMLAGRTSITELIALLRQCHLFLGADSGPLHLASFLGVPSVSIYGPTDPANSGPLGPDATVLRGSANCMPCYDLKRHAVCWRGDLLCMSQVTVDQVFEAARERMERASLSGPHPDPLPEGEGETGTLPEGETGILLDGEGDTVVTESHHSSPITHQPSLETHHSSLITHHSSLFRRILVVKLAGIGDLLTSFPALEALRGHYPHAEITALVTPQSASILDGTGLVDRVIELDKYVFDTTDGFTDARSLRGLARLAREIRGRAFDAVVLFHHLVTPAGIMKYALLSLASGAKVRAGLDDGRGWFLNFGARDRGFGAVHEVDYWLEVVALLGATNEHPRVKIAWGEEEERFADRVWAEMGLSRGERVVAIHPGAGSYSPARRWHPERFSAVATALAEDGLVPMVVAGPEEEELARSVMDGIPTGSLLLRGTRTPKHLAAVLARCRLFVGNDSGVMHVAAAAGLPVVAVFGPSNHRAWGPYDPDGVSSAVVRVGLQCSPCLYRGQSLGLRNGCGDTQCLDRINPSAVVQAARDLLSRQR
jgi:ADP-heptose:LPS heptosyltransferase